jgi:hypothetical protein
LGVDVEAERMPANPPQLKERHALSGANLETPLASDRHRGQRFH